MKKTVWLLMCTILVLGLCSSAGCLSPNTGNIPMAISSHDDGMNYALGNEHVSHMLADIENANRDHWRWQTTVIILLAFVLLIALLFKFGRPIIRAIRRR